MTREIHRLIDNVQNAREHFNFESGTYRKPYEKQQKGINDLGGTMVALGGEKKQYIRGVLHKPGGVLVFESTPNKSRLSVQTDVSRAKALRNIATVLIGKERVTKETNPMEGNLTASFEETMQTLFRVPEKAKRKKAGYKTAYGEIQRNPDTVSLDIHGLNKQQLTALVNAVAVHVEK
ncbi:MAG: hypothetical protein V1834_04315 [Candidatus Micrarchaeota archaeon]